MKNLNIIVGILILATTALTLAASFEYASPRSTTPSAAAAPRPSSTLVSPSPMAVMSSDWQ